MHSEWGIHAQPSWYLWYVLPFSMGYSVTLAVNDWVSLESGAQHKPNQRQGVDAAFQNNLT